MTVNDIHDVTVEKLAAGLKTILQSRTDTTVLTRTLWQPLSDFPTCIYRFDVIVVIGPVVFVTTTTDEPVLQPTPQMWARAVFDIIRREDNEAEFYDKPDLLVTAPVSEYCLIDPTREVMRPPLNAARKHDGGYVRVRSCADNVLFSSAGVRLELSGTEVVLTRCDHPRIAEQIHELSKHRSRLTDQTAIAGLERRIAELETKLAEGRNRPGGTSRGSK